MEWPDVQILPLGSLVTGLATNTSDVDFVIQVNNNNGKVERSDLIDHALRMLKQNYETYSLVSRSTGSARGMPIIKLYHVPTDRSCDITFSSQTGVENSRLLGYYFKLDPRIRQLAAILKYWSKIHRLKRSGILRNYLLYLLIIFYLEQIHMVPPYMLLEQSVSCHFYDEWDTRFNAIPYKPSNRQDVYQLLGGFFKYYSTLNFIDNVLSLRVGKVYPRSVFQNIISIPEEFAVYKDYLKRPDSAPLVLDTALCVQDMFEHNNNVAGAVRAPQADALLSYFKCAAQMFEDLPRDDFLRSLLAKDDHLDLIIARDSTDRATIRN